MTDNFEKDINVPSKEQIIIDGVNVSECDYYYCNNDGEHRCFKNDSLATCDAACSYAAFYLKEQLSQKTQECEEMKNNLHIANTNHEALEQFQNDYFKGLDTTTIAELAKKSIRLTKEHCSDLQKIEKLQQECKKLKERATIAEDNFACEVQARLYHQNEWLKFSKECEELKKQLKTSEKWRINAENLNEKLDIKNTRYRKALEEIEGLVKNFCKDCGDYENCNWDKEGCYYSLIPNLKDIINKAKE